MRIKAILPTILSISVLAVSSLAAQETAMPSKENMAMIYFMHVKKGMQAQFEAALKMHAAWRKANNDPWTWHVFQVMTGENVGSFLVRSGDHTWADFDHYREFTQKAAAHFWTTVGPYIDSISNEITQVDMKNIKWPEGGDSYPLLMIEEFQIRFGHDGALRRVMEKFQQATTQANWPGHYAWEWTVSGGTVPSVALVLPFKDWASMKPPKKSPTAFLTEVYGADEAKALVESFSGAIATESSFIIRDRADLVPAQ